VGQYLVANVAASTQRDDPLRARALAGAGFVEVETPMLNPIPPGGGETVQDVHNALDSEFYLRIAPELWLKRLVVGGFERSSSWAASFSQRRREPAPQPRVHDARALTPRTGTSRT